MLATVGLLKSSHFARDMATGYLKEGTDARGWLSNGSRALGGAGEAKRPRMAVATAAAATGVVAMFLCITEAAGGLGATAEGESPMQELRPHVTNIVCVFVVRPEPVRWPPLTLNYKHPPHDHSCLVHSTRSASTPTWAWLFVCGAVVLQPTFLSPASMGPAV